MMNSNKINEIHLGLEDWVEASLARRRLERNNSFEQLAKLTVVIASFGRPDFLMRQAVYWGYSKAQIIIVDGSPQPLTDRMRKIMDGVSNIRYLHASEGYFSRMKLAAEYIQSPYVVTLADDGFLFKGALCRAIALLDKNNELVACNGQVVNFDPTALKAGISYYKSDYTFWKYAILENKVEDRLAHAMGTYNAATCYSVLRRDVWIRAWGRNIEVCASPSAGEIYLAITIYLYGKLDTLDDVFVLHSNENPSISIKSFDRNLTFLTWWRSPRFAAEREDFINRLATIAMDCLGINVTESRKIVENAVASYLALCEDRKKGALLRSIRNTTRVTISKMLRRIMPPSVFRALQLRVRKLFGVDYQGGGGNEIDVRQMAVGSSDALNNQIEIQLIENLVLEFYEVRAKNKVIQ